MYGYICPDCGAHLDPGEKCDCLDKKVAVREKKETKPIVITVGKNGQLKIAG